MRTCVVTKEQLPKMELLRIVKTDDGIVVDETGKVNGHGCYIKKDISTLELAKSKKILDKALETTITDDVYETITNIINK